MIQYRCPKVSNSNVNTTRESIEALDHGFDVGVVQVVVDAIHAMWQVMARR